MKLSIVKIQLIIGYHELFVWNTLIQLQLNCAQINYVI